MRGKRSLAEKRCPAEEGNAGNGLWVAAPRSRDRRNSRPRRSAEVETARQTATLRAISPAKAGRAQPNPEGVVDPRRRTVGSSVLGTFLWFVSCRATRNERSFSYRYIKIPKGNAQPRSFSYRNIKNPKATPPPPPPYPPFPSYCPKKPPQTQKISPKKLKKPLAIEEKMCYTIIVQLKMIKESGSQANPLLNFARESPEKRSRHVGYPKEARTPKACPRPPFG